MTVIEKLRLIERMDGLIRRKATGTPKELAEKLKISERSVYNLIRQMKEMGGPIIYSNSDRAYKYERLVNFNIGFTDLSSMEKRIVGGNYVKVFICDRGAVAICPPQHIREHII